VPAAAGRNAHKKIIADRKIHKSVRKKATRPMEVRTAACWVCRFLVHNRSGRKLEQFANRIRSDTGCCLPFSREGTGEIENSVCGDVWNLLPGSNYRMLVGLATGNAR